MMPSLHYRQVLQVNSYPRNATLALALQELFYFQALDSSQPRHAILLTDEVRLILGKLEPIVLPKFEECLDEAANAIEALSHDTYARTALQFRELAKLMKATLSYDRRLVAELNRIKTYLLCGAQEGQAYMKGMLRELSVALDTYILSGSQETEEELVALFHVYFHKDKRAMLLGSEADDFYRYSSSEALLKIQELVEQLEVYLLLRSSGQQKF